MTSGRLIALVAALAVAVFYLGEGADVVEQCAEASNLDWPVCFVRSIIEHVTAGRY